jgi:GNAT superfamily N-acetyltransferase
MTIVLDTVAPADAAEVQTLMSRVIAASVAADARHLEEMVANVNSNVAFWLQQPGQCVHIKASAQGRIVGVVLVKNFWNLCSLFVDPAWQHQGCGRALTEAASLGCKGRSPEGAIFLNAATSAIPFYQHLGFRFRESKQPLPPGFRAMQRPL